MATTATLPLTVWRNDEVCELPLRVRGVDLTDVALAMQFRAGGDAPGPPLADLVKVTNGNAEGLRVAGIKVVDGVPESDVRIRINKSTRQALPYDGEMGDPARVEYALLIGGRTRLIGPAFLPAHAYGSDDAPAARPPSWGTPTQVGMPIGGATLTIGADDVVMLTIDGADLIGAVVDVAKAAAVDASAARDKAQDWAESAGEPGGPGTKSAKGWAVSIGDGIAGAGGVDAIDAMLGQVNAFDKSKAISNTVIPDGAVPRVEAGYYATDFMAVPPGGKIIFNVDGVPFGGFGIQFYRSDRTFLSSASSPQAGTVIDIPARAAWARTSFPNSVPRASVMMVHGATLPAFREFGVLNLARAETLIGELTDSPPINLLRRANITLNSKYNDQNGQAVEAVDGWFRTDFMRCRGGVPVYVSPGNNLNQGFFAYDENKQLLVAYDPAFYVGAATFTPPLGAYYWRLHGFTSRLPDLQYATNGTSPVSAAAATPAMLSDVAGQWSGLLWAHQGDSLDDNTDSNANGYQWVERAAAFHGMTTRNFALGGRLSAGALRRKNGALLTSADFAGVAVSSIKLGTNDALQGVPVGDMSDALTAGTFIANIRQWLATTYAWNKATRQVLCTPPKLSNANVDPYADAIRAVAQREGVPVLDFHRVSGIGPLTYADKLTDGTHMSGAARPGALGSPAIGFFKTCLPPTAIGS